MPKIPFLEEVDLDEGEEEEEAAAFLAAFLEGGVGGVESVPVEGVEKMARRGSPSSTSTSGV